MNLQTKVKLNNAVEIPILGLGVYQSRAGAETQNAVKTAIEAGYRHIDTARIYGNEKDVGAAVRDSGVPRSEIFVTTKLWNSDHGYDRAIRACNDSLKRLGLDFVDLYLVHWPVEKLRLESWRAMETLLAEGKCRAIGVSNYMVRHLEELLAVCKMKPAVNQIEMNPYIYEHFLDVINLCNQQEIVVEAYSPLTKGHKLSDSRLMKIAEGYRKSAAQVLIRWALQHHFVVIPKSAKPGRIRDNANVFDFSISTEDMTALDSFNEDLVTGWDPTRAP
jgi:diketogulonate reductase-like aldo/keto reductase